MEVTSHNCKPLSWKIFSVGEIFSTDENSFPGGENPAGTAENRSDRSQRFYIRRQAKSRQ